MKHAILAAAALSVCACGDDANDTTMNPSPGSTMTFFVSSATNATGNLGGLAGADGRCQSLAAAVGAGGRTWRAYLSVERDPATGQPVDARSRIGSGPWVNAGGTRVAQDLTELHARRGDAALFVDERNQRINGQWAGSPQPVEHDVPHRLDGRRTTDGGHDLRRLDVSVRGPGRAGRPLGRARTEHERGGLAVVVELGARERELREHDAARRIRPDLLLRLELTASRRRRLTARARRA
jgi:hypothetical protein